MPTLQGKRIYNDSAIYKSPPGSYCLITASEWRGELWFQTPNGHLGRVGRVHTIKEEPDESITVEPSIIMFGGVDGKQELFHGWLKNGVWFW